MTTAQSIASQLEHLPESAQREVLDFVEFLRARSRKTTVREDDATWYSFSVESAMRGMEEEPSPYTL